MTEDAKTDDTLSVLHDHYKETFALIRDWESQRNRLFLWLLVIFAVLAIEIQYPANFHGALGHLEIAGNTVDLQLLPLARLLNVSWVFTAAFVLKYYQATKTTERQYPYLHILEEHISGRLGNDDLYRREGKSYLKNYPRLLDWAWIYYTVLFPAALIIAVFYLLGIEWVALNYAVASKLFDSIFGISILVTLSLYLYARLFQRYQSSKEQQTAPQTAAPPLLPATQPPPAPVAAPSQTIPPPASQP